MIMRINIKKTLFSILSALLISFHLVPMHVYADSSYQQESNIFTLSDLGVEADIVLKGPFESETIRFDLPPNWVLQDGAEINLEISAYFASSDPEQIEALTNNFAGALLDIYFNEGLQKSVPLVNSENVSYRIPISVKDLASTREDGSYSITLALDAAIDCDYEFHKTTIVVKNSSFLILPHSEVSLDMDLRRLPWPLYQERSNSVFSTLVVLPDTPSSDEIQSGMIIMGAFGRMTSGRLPMSMVSYSDLTDDLLGQSDLIFVGKPGAFPTLSELDLSFDIVNGNFSSPDILDDDGLLEIVTSPWNDSKSILLVSGKSDVGVVKAAQALSTGNVQTGLTSAYAVVAQVNPIALSDELTQPTSPEIPFSSLGYPAVTLDSLGPNYFTYEFTVPSGQAPLENPFVEFRFSNSALVDPVRSDFAVFLNDVVVGSIQLSEGTSSFTTAKIDLPSSLLRFGVNRLDLVVTLIPRDECSVLAFSGLWATIFSDSYIHLPLTRIADSALLFQDLKSYPYPFASDSSFSNTTIVVPENSASAWFVAGKVAYDLGARVDGSLISFETAFDGDVSDLAKNGNLIVIGEPRELQLLQEMKDAMPAYFEENSNIAVLETQQVIYRVSEEKSIGYLEIFTSPWSPESFVLGVFGTNLDGLEYAFSAISNFRIRETLSGDFSTYDGGIRAIVIDTRTGIGLGRLEAGLGAENVELQPATSAPASNTAEDSSVGNSRPLIMYGIIAVIAVMIVVVVIMLQFSRKKNRS
jgi:cellulose synthase operon protein B